MSKSNGKREPVPRKPYKFDENRQKAYLDLIAQGGRRHASARAVGITPQTVCVYIRSHPEFEDAIQIAETESNDEVEDALRSAALSGNVTACLAWLYSRSPKRWKDERKVNARIELTWREKAQELGYDPDAIVHKAATAIAELGAGSGNRGSD